MDRIVKAVRHCMRCEADNPVILVRNITTSGVSQVYWQCQVCKKSTTKPMQYIHHKRVEMYGLDVNQIPVIEDYSKDGPPCDVRGCENRGTEVHHVAPRHLFGDNADSWPTINLCKLHHDEWHKKVTPNMAGKGIINGRANL